MSPVWLICPVTSLSFKWFLHKLNYRTQCSYPRKYNFEIDKSTSHCLLSGAYTNYITVHNVAITENVYLKQKHFPLPFKLCLHELYYTIQSSYYRQYIFEIDRSTCNCHLSGACANYITVHNVAMTEDINLKQTEALPIVF